VTEAARRNGLETVLWNLDAGDDHHDSAGEIESHAIHRAQPGSIVLMHDGGHHRETPKALPSIIRGLRARGFQLVTVSALLGGHIRYRREGGTG
jgi:peptidoglycan-N-acetylglucosamine deacetylase